MLIERAIALYDPAADMAARYPDWQVVVMTRLPKDAREMWVEECKMVAVGADTYEADPQYVLAHLVAHLDWEHDLVGPFAHEQEMQAKFLAQVRLDREETRNDPLNQLRLPGFTWPEP